MGKELVFKHGKGRKFIAGKYAAVTLFEKQVVNMDWEALWSQHKDKCRYMLVSGREKGLHKKDSEPHWHVYLQLKSKMKLETLQNWFNANHDTHIELLMNHRHYMKYCRKVKSRIAGEQPKEFGVMILPYQTKEGEFKITPLRYIAEMIDNGSSLEKIKTDYPSSYLQFSSNIKKVYNERLVTLQPEFRALDVILYYGDSGIGKSREVRAIAKQLGDYYVVQPKADRNSKQWMEGYKGQKTLILDDMNGQFDVCWFLRLIDGYAISLEFKGGFAPGQYTTVFITSNYGYDQWFPKTYEKNVQIKNAVYRRINRICYMSYATGALIEKNEEPVKVEDKPAEDIFNLLKPKVNNNVNNVIDIDLDQYEESESESPAGDGGESDNPMLIEDTENSQIVEKTPYEPVDGQMEQEGIHYVKASKEGTEEEREKEPAFINWKQWKSYNKDTNTILAEMEKIEEEDGEKSPIYKSNKEVLEEIGKDLNSSFYYKATDKIPENNGKLNQIPQNDGKKNGNLI
nr:MAG: replication associated protein [Cressdnaviricota sp.]